MSALRRESYPGNLCPFLLSGTQNPVMSAYPSAVDHLEVARHHNVVRLDIPAGKEIATASGRSQSGGATIRQQPPTPAADQVTALAMSPFPPPYARRLSPTWCVRVADGEPVSGACASPRTRCASPPLPLHETPVSHRAHVRMGRPSPCLRPSPCSSAVSLGCRLSR